MVQSLISVNRLSYEVHSGRPAPTRALSRINQGSASSLAHIGQWLGDSSSRPRTGNDTRQI